MTAKAEERADTARAAVLALPDEPRNLDLRGLALRGAPVVGGGAGAVVLVAEMGLGAVWGRPPAEALEQLRTLPRQPAEQAPGKGEPPEVLVPREHLAGLLEEAPWLAGWDREDALLHRLPAGWGSGQSEDGNAGVPGYEILTLLPGGEAVETSSSSSPRPERWRDGLPAGLRFEIGDAWSRGRAVAAAFPVAEDGSLGPSPVAFCLAAVETEGLWDVSIETLEGHRRRGLAAATFRALAAWYREALGKTPVWGAHAGNTASRRLAHRLGFERLPGPDGRPLAEEAPGELVVLSRPGGER